MHAEAVREDAIPSKKGLLRYESETVNAQSAMFNYVWHYYDELSVDDLSGGILQRKLL